MNFFNFKRKHWVMLGIFTVGVVAMAVWFVFFIEKKSQEVVAEVRGYIIPEPFRVSSDEVLDADPATIDDGSLSVQVGSVQAKDDCKSCTSTKEMSAPAEKEQ